MSYIPFLPLVRNSLGWLTFFDFYAIFNMDQVSLHGALAYLPYTPRAPC